MAATVHVARLSQDAIALLRGAVRGELITPDDGGYEAARAIWNGMIERRPAAILRCTGVADVVAGIRFGRDHGLPVAVRGGGHNVAGNALCDGGIVLDLSPMSGVRVDPAKRTVRVGGGARLGDVDHEAQAYGLAVPVGVVSATGIAGLSLHGGMGFLLRRFGLTCDNLIAADVVLADGRIIQVDEQNHPDLLWALRGGGGNFGVVTSFEFQAHPVGPEVWLGITFYPAAQAASVLAGFRDYATGAPDELMSLALFWNSPDDESLPPEARNQPVLVAAGCWSGPMDQGERMIQPLRELGTPLIDLSGPYPYEVAQKLFDPDYPNGRRYYWKSTYLSELGDEVIRSLVGHAARRPSPISSLDVWVLGGAMARVAPGATAFSERQAPYMLGIEANWDEPADDAVNIAWAREVYQDMQRHSTGWLYLNFPGFAEEGEEVLRASYGGGFERLRQIKALYDPENLFRTNFNIPPAD